MGRLAVGHPSCSNPRASPLVLVTKLSALYSAIVQLVGTDKLTKQIVETR